MVSMSLSIQLEEVFGNLDPQALQICENLCNEYVLTADEINTKWDTFALNNSIEDEPNLENLEQFRMFLEKSAQAKTKKQQKLSENSIKDKVSDATTVVRANINAGLVRNGMARNLNVDDFFNLVEDMTPMDIDHGNSGGAPGFRREGPVTYSMKEMQVKNQENLDLQALPGDDDQDQVYMNRTGKFKLLEQSGKLEKNPNQQLQVPSQKWSFSFILQGVALDKTAEEKMHFRYMNEEIGTRRDFIYNKIQKVGKAIIQKLPSSFPAPSPEAFISPSQSNVLAVGHIRCDIDKDSELNQVRLTLPSVLLESDEGNRVKLDTRLTCRELFVVPGQIVAVEGVNPTGKLLTANNIYDDASPLSVHGMAHTLSSMLDSKDGSQKTDAELVNNLRTEETMTGDKSEIKHDMIMINNEDTVHKCHTRIIAAAGPFTTTNNMHYRPLQDLIEYTKGQEVDLLLLMGPFVDNSHPLLDSEDLSLSSQEIFQSRVYDLIHEMYNISGKPTAKIPHIVLIPSLEDAHHDFVVPQPAMIAKQNSTNIHLGSNPCVFSLKNGTENLLIGASSLPVIEDINRECICVGHQDRFKAISSYIVRQQNFYPLFPPSKDVPFDTMSTSRLDFPEGGNLNFLFLKSKLKPFCEVVNNNVICVNPGHLCRGEQGGTFVDIVFSQSRTIAESFKGCLMKL